MKIDTSSFGRILAQTAKQVIIQRIREAERDTVYEEYKDRQGEIVNGIVRRFEKGAIIVDLGRAEAVLPPKEQVPRENYRPNDRVRAYVLEVNKNAKGSQIVLSRACIEMLTKLFEQEVPEIYEGIVSIKSAAREPGGRSKIAVASRDSDVDPVGACVGMKGSRVQAVVQELRGERIDIVPWSADPARYVCSALSPAQVSRVIIDDGDKSMDVIVPDDQLSLAIGRKGQNVRLAVQLTGWKIDIKSESKMRELARWLGEAVSVVEGCGERRGRAAAAAGHHVARGSLALRPGAADAAAGHRREGRARDPAARGRARGGEAAQRGGDARAPRRRRRAAPRRATPRRLRAKRTGEQRLARGRTGARSGAHGNDQGIQAGGRARHRPRRVRREGGRARRRAQERDGPARGRRRQRAAREARRPQAARRRHRATRRADAAAPP